MKAEFLEALICSTLLSGTQEETEALKGKEVCPRPLSSVEEVGLELDPCPDPWCFFIQFPKTPSGSL